MSPALARRPGAVSPFEADARGGREAIHRDPQALLETIGLAQEERQVVLRTDLRFEGARLAGDPDGDPQVVEAGIDVAETDEVHAEQVEQPWLAVV